MMSKTIKEVLAGLASEQYHDRKMEPNGVLLLCSVPARGPMAWHHEIHPPLPEVEVVFLSHEIGQALPLEFAELLRQANGLNLFSDHIRLCGRRTSINRSIDAPRVPYSIVIPNTLERPRNLAKSKFIIGSYFWDGSKLCIDRDTNQVECFTPDFKTVITSWVSIAVMLDAEIVRLKDHFDENGNWICQSRPTTPVAH